MTPQDVYQAKSRIARVARRTALDSSDYLSSEVGASVHLKLENHQITGSFKLRGAANKLLALSADQKARGVITFSTGNHGRAVAYMAQKLGIPAVVCLSSRVPEYRLDYMRRCGAEVVQHGTSQDEAMERAKALEQERGLTLVSAFDDPHIIAGQGTIGIEILEDLPAVDSAIVPLSGGGLISGVALVMKAVNPKIRVVGVTMDCAPAMYLSVQAGKPVEVEEQETLADALLGGIGLENRYTFRMVQQLVDDIVLVSEEEIADGMFAAFDRQRLVVEGSGAVGISALLHKKIGNLGKSVAVVVSGGFVAPSVLAGIATERYAKVKR